MPLQPPVEVALFHSFAEASTHAKQLATTYHEPVEIHRSGRQWSVRAGTLVVEGLMGWGSEAREAAKRTVAKRARKVEPTEHELDEAIAEQSDPSFRQDIEEALEWLAGAEAEPDYDEEQGVDDYAREQQEDLWAEIVEDEEHYARSDETGWFYPD